MILKNWPICGTGWMWMAGRECWNWLASLRDEGKISAGPADLIRLLKAKGGRRLLTVGTAAPGPPA